MNLKYAKIQLKSSLQDEEEQVMSEHTRFDEKRGAFSFEDDTKFIQNEPPACVKIEVDMNTFFQAACEKDLVDGIAWKNVKKLLEIDSAGNLAKFQDGSTLLMVFCDSPEAVEYLLENGSDPNAVDAKGFSVVMHAISCQKPSAEVLDMLIRAGASLKLPEPSKDVFSFALTRFPPPLEQSSRMPEIVPALEFLFSMANKARSVQLPDFYKDIFASLMEYNWTTIDVFVSTCISVMMSPFFNPAKLYALPIEKVPEQDSLASYLHLCGISIMGLLDKDYFFVNALGYFLNTYFKNNPTQNTNLSILLQDVNKTLLLVEEEGIVVPPALLMLYLYFQKKITQRDELSINIYDLLNYFTLLKGRGFPTYPTHQFSGPADFLRNVPIELALTHFLIYVETRSECVELYKSLLAYCPVHPFALHWIDKTLTSKSANASLRNACNKNSATVDRVIEYIVKACGTKVGGVANTSGSEGPYFSSKLDNKSPASLKVMSIWASRMAIAASRVTKSLSLPVYIKKLGERGFLPMGLAHELLVFPPTRLVPY